MALASFVGSAHAQHPKASPFTEARQTGVGPMMPFTPLKPIPAAPDNMNFINTPPSVTLPTPGTFAIDVPGQGFGHAPGSVISVGADPKAHAVPGSVHVRVLDPKATATLASLGSGVLGFTIARSDHAAAASSASIQLDYSKFRDAFGADWASRLMLLQYPACVLTTPTDPACATATRLDSTNDVGNGIVSGSLGVDPDPTAAAASKAPKTSAHVEAKPNAPKAAKGRDAGFRPHAGLSAGGSVFVLAGASSSPAGTLSATDLREASRWQAGGSSGDFSWDYPIPLPKAAVGPTPDLRLSYSSQSVDGYTAAENNQPSPVGLGWELTGLGYVERQYTSCDQDGWGIQDDCWYADNATLNLNGQSTRLIKSGTVSGTNWVRWYAEDDPGWLVLQRFDASSSNATYNHEWWQVITTDGTQYRLGYGQDVRSAPAATNSAWTVPVYGNNAGEPCYTGNVNTESCTQGWRWNLDRITDTNGNQTTVTYSAETNYYERQGLPADITSYVRGGAPTEVDYSMANSPAHIPDKVVFSYKWRCVEDMPGGSGTCGSSGSSWPDVPIDQDCSSSSCTNVAPTFYTK